MTTLREYLSTYRGIDVTADDAAALGDYWAELTGRRGSSPAGEQATDDIPVVFDATGRPGHE